jgi:hypothetical protein
MRILMVPGLESNTPLDNVLIKVETEGMQTVYLCYCIMTFKPLCPANRKAVDNHHFPGADKTQTKNNSAPHPAPRTPHPVPCT